MADRNNPFQNQTQGNGLDMMSDAASQVKQDIEHLVEGFDVQTILRRVEDFGRENPVGLALTAVTLGVAVGFLMRTPKSTQNRPLSPV
jgi:hypothetical protein